jgi:Lysylphosphatidylglycerol synthase TM region
VDGTGPAHAVEGPAGAGPHGTRAGRYGTRYGLAVAALGAALFVVVVLRTGPDEIVTGFQKIRWNLIWIVLLGGVRFAARAAAWTLAIEPPHRLGLGAAINAVVCGDALGNITPLGPLVGEPAKVACVRGRVPLGAALTALAIENVLYTLSVAAMIAAGTILLLLSVDVPEQIRSIGQVGIAGVAALFLAVAWIAWRRPATLGGPVFDWLAPRLTPRTRSLVDRIRSVEQEVYTFAARRGATIVPIAALELTFHLVGVLEAYVTLAMIRPSAPPFLSAFILETVNRLVTVAFKFVPFQVGVAEAGTAVVADMLSLGSAAGLTLSLVRKARMGVWSLIGMGLLVRHGLTTRGILEDDELKAVNSQLPKNH